MLDTLALVALSLPHGNADPERGFSINKHLLEVFFLEEKICFTIVFGFGQLLRKPYKMRFNNNLSIHIFRDMVLTLIVIQLLLFEESRTILSDVVALVMLNEGILHRCTSKIWAVPSG